MMMMNNRTKEAMKTKLNFNPPKDYRYPACDEPQVHCWQKFPVKMWFEYHCWENEESQDADLWHHTHQRCEVLRRLPPKESDYEMYEIRFSDGFQKTSFADELFYNKKNFNRPDYAKK
jgi:hypothetical protein